MIDCYMCKGTGFKNQMKNPAIPYPHLDMENAAIDFTRCDFCNGIGKLELMAVTFEGSHIAREMEKKIAELELELNWHKDANVRLIAELNIYKQLHKA